MVTYNAYGCPISFVDRNYDDDYYTHDKHIQNNPMIRKQQNEYIMEREGVSWQKMASIKS